MNYFIGITILVPSTRDKAHIAGKVVGLGLQYNCMVIVT